MVTLAQIDDLHARLGRAETLGDYLRGLAALGVVRSESFVSDGHTEYVEVDGQRVASPPHHELMEVARSSDRDEFLRHLADHAEGRTSYVEMSHGLAQSGVERWVADTEALTMTYVGRDGAVLLIDDVG